MVKISQAKAEIHWRILLVGMAKSIHRSRYPVDPGVRVRTSHRGWSAALCI